MSLPFTPKHSICSTMSLLPASLCLSSTHTLHVPAQWIRYSLCLWSSLPSKYGAISTHVFALLLLSFFQLFTEKLRQTIQCLLFPSGLWNCETTIYPFECRLASRGQGVYKLLHSSLPLFQLLKHFRISNLVQNMVEHVWWLLAVRLPKQDS